MNVHSILHAWSVPDNIHAGNSDMMEGKQKMKSSYTPTEHMAERATAYAMNILEVNLDRYRAMYICAACEMFGLGGKRANKLIDEIFSKVKSYEDYDDPIIMDDKIKEELTSYGIDPTRLFTAKFKTVEQIEAEQRTKKKAHQPTFAESLKMKQNLEKIQALMRK